MGDLDEMLREFLEREKKNPLDEIKTRLANAADWQVEHETKDEARHKELMEFRVSQERRVTSLEKDVEHLTKDVDRVEETTGSHNIPEILKAARGPVSKPPLFAKAFEGEIGKWVGRAVGAALVAAVTWVVHEVAFPRQAPAATHAPEPSRSAP